MTRETLKDQYKDDDDDNDLRPVGVRPCLFLNITTEDVDGTGFPAECNGLAGAEDAVPPTCS